MMTTAQQNAMNTELWQGIGYIADDETLMRRLARYVKRLAKEKSDDPTLMTKEEFFAKLEKGEEEYLQGKYYEMLPGESLDDFLKRVG
jgi:hypothetical protein